MTTRGLDVTNLEIECEADGGSKVVVWVKCWTPEDIDDVILWLNLARTFLTEWRNIRSKSDERSGE